ncbi:mechanosensitive ion channel family protein [Granulosicoccus sp.]|nr:mechanosensitive ion channel family protein [Granulosicoccus sp.]MDB4224705.1 mechanosensitive ion channel family protein [Granulosicoccus sp.]
MNEAFSEFFSHVTAAHYLIIGANVLLMLLAKPILLKIGGKLSARQMGFRVNMLRVLNLAILATVSYNAIYSSDSNNGQDHQGFVIKLISILVVLYLAYLASNVGSYIMRLRYGKTTTSDDGTRISETYHSRMLTLVVSTFIAIVALIAVIRIAGFNSMLEAGGVIGFAGVFLALTQQAWAPDIISGLVLLNSDMLSEGDIIELGDSNPLIARVFKTKIFHTVLIDIVNNHRIMVSNSTLRAQTIHSLSKFASAKGLREKLTFKIGYDTNTGDVKAMLNEAFGKIANDDENTIDNSHPLEIRVLETGDHAVEWGIFYYIKEVNSIISVRQQLIEEILETSVAHGISLSTPQTHTVSNQ